MRRWGEGAGLGLTVCLLVACAARSEPWQVYTWDGEGFVRLPHPSLVPSPSTPSSWTVTHAAYADLTGDGPPEWALLVMWYGRINMRLQKPDETRMALLITHILRHTTVDGQPAADVWARVYDPTVFIVGKADDLGFHEYGTLWDAIYGPDAPPAAIADDALLQTFTQAARQLPPPQINIAQGGVYSYYEFRWPMDDRLTDEAWRAMLAAGRAPDRPEWTASLSVNELPVQEPKGREEA